MIRQGAAGGRGGGAEQKEFVLVKGAFTTVCIFSDFKLNVVWHTNEICAALLPCTVSAETRVWAYVNR